MLSPLRSKTIRKSRLLLPLTLLVNVDLNLLFCPSLKFLQSYSNLFFSLSLSSLAFPQKTPFKPRVFPPSHSFQTPARFEFSAALPHRFSSSPNGANIDVSSPEALSRSAIAHSSAMNGGAGSLFSHDHFVPSPDVVTSIVLPTILFCILMVIAMLIGINKCKQWELDKVVEMRRTRRVLERITHRLRERNFRTIERARNIRKRNTVGAEPSQTTQNSTAPPLYSVNPPKSGTSPPPSYEDALLDQYYSECLPSSASRSTFLEESGLI